MRCRILRAGLIVLFLVPQLALTAEWIDWQWVNPLPQGWDLNAIAALPAGGAAAVGDGGTILVLGDGEWRMTMTGMEFDLVDVTMDGEVAVAVGGTFIATGEVDAPDYAYFVTSRDGIAWAEQRFEDRGAVPRVVIHDGGKFVAIGTGFLAISSNGIDWLQYPPPSELVEYSIIDVAWNGDRFVAAAAYPVGLLGWGPRAILVSDDGTTWDALTLPDAIPRFNLEQVVWGNGRFVAHGQQRIMTSTDGVDWEMSSGEFPQSEFRRFFFVEGRFLALGFDLDHVAMWTATSTDGLSWVVEDSTSGVDQLIEAMAWIDDHLEAVGSTGLMATSVDGVAWAATSTNTVPFIIGGLADLAMSGDRSIIVAVGSQNTVTVSQDGTHWVSQRLLSVDPEDHIRKVHWINDEFWVGSRYGWIWHSADGNEWKLVRDEPIGPLEIYDIAGNEEILVAAGENWDEMCPMVLTSFDGGRTWSSLTFPYPGTGFTRITWWRDQFIALGSGGLVMTSADGNDWTYRRMEEISHFKEVASNATAMVILASEQGLLLRTEDGQSFETILAPIRGLRDVSWTGHVFVAVGREGIVTSRDGRQWIAEPVGLGWEPRCVEGRDTELYVAGLRGSILRARSAAVQPRRTGGRVQ